MADEVSAELLQLVSHEQINNAFWKAVRLFVGRGRRFSAEELSAASGVHRRSLDCYRGYQIGHPDHRPLDEAQRWSIASVIGADLTTEWIKLIGQAAYNLPDIEPDPGSLAADNSDDNAALVRAAMDGKFDKSERPGLKEVGARMVERGVQLVAISGRA